MMRTFGFGRKEARSMCSPSPPASADLAEAMEVRQGAAIAAMPETPRKHRRDMPQHEHPVRSISPRMIVLLQRMTFKDPG